MFDQPFVAIPDVLASHGRFRAGRPAFSDHRGALDWGGAARRVDAAAAALAKRGAVRGDAVALLVGNDAEACIALFATLRMGGVAVPLSPMLDAATLAGMARDSGARLLIAAPELAPLADAVAALVPGIAVVPIGSLAGAGGCAAPRLAPGDACNIIYSSGTTGVPKGIVHTHGSRALGAIGLAVEFRIDRTAVVMLATPLFTNGTWMMLLPAVAAGASLVCVPRFSPAEFLATVEREAVSHAFLVPTMIRALLDCPDFDRFDLSSLRIVVSAGSALPAAWKAEAVARLGGRLLELYGLTEGIATTLHPDDMAARPGSVGTPVAGIDLRIVGEDGGELAAGEIGEIVGYGSGLMAGYHNRPDATAEAIWRDAEGRTFLRTGDMGRLDGDGFLTIVDRRKDMIVSGGINVFASDIEAIFRTHPGVADVAVIGQPHPRWVETPVAIVIPGPGADPDPVALADWANARLGKYQRVQAVVIRRSDFPRNVLGKVLKKLLREAAA